MSLSSAQINHNTRETYFYIEMGFMYRQPREWDKEDIGMGDALGRTALATIVFNDARMLESLFHNAVDFDNPKGRPIIFRHHWAPDTVSRDHVAMLLAALYIHGGIHRGMGRMLARDLKFRLSDKHVQTPDFWLWTQSLLKPWVGYVWQIFSILQFAFVVPWNWFWRELTEDLPEDWRRVTDKLQYPTYALFVFAWQYYCTPKGWLRTLLGRLARRDAESENYVIRGLLGQDVSYDFVVQYRSKKGLSWSNHSKSASRVPLPVASAKDIEFNDLDGQCLRWVYFNQYL